MGACTPTQGKTLAVMQVLRRVSNRLCRQRSLRVLGRWMRMVTIPQPNPSVPKAFDGVFDETIDEALTVSNEPDRRKSWKNVKFTCW